MATIRRYPALLQRRKGTLERTANTLCFRFDDSPAEPIYITGSNLQIRVDGKNNTFFILYDIRCPDNQVLTQEEHLISELADSGLAIASQALRTARIRKTWRRTWLFGVIGGSLALIIVLPLTLALIPAAWLNRLVTIEAETRWRTEIQKSLNIPSDNSSVRNMVKKLVVRLGEVSPALNGRDIDVAIRSTSEVNAFALPGGLIIVNTGLIEQAQSVDEVTAILAHELGHVQSRHAMKAVLNSLGVTAGITILSLLFSSELPGALRGGANLFSLKFSREQELEADRAGLELCLKAGVNPEGFLNFLDRMKAREHGTVGKALSVLLTHPLSEERIAHLRRIMISDARREKSVAPIFTIEELKKNLPASVD